jgi:hypothetical protein
MSFSSVVGQVLVLIGISAPRRLRWTFGVISLLALGPMAAQAQGYGQIGYGQTPARLQVVQGRITYGPVPADSQVADWLFENVSLNSFRLKNRKSNSYLSHQNGAVTLGPASPGSIWELVPGRPPIGFQIRPAGSDLVLVAAGDKAVVALVPSASADTNRQWGATWSDMPDFATQLLDRIDDWTKADLKERDALLLAAFTLVIAKDNAKSLELKRRWARVFPYEPAPGTANAGTDIQLSGKPLDTQSSHFYVAETRIRFSTGFYAAPGEEITITVPEAFTAKGAQLQIGHVDSPRFQNSSTPFGRFPFRMITSANIDSSAERVAGGLRKVRLRNGFGGTIYIIGNAGFDPANTRVHLVGGVRMPVFQLGKTSLEAWRKEIRHYPAPWAEIGSPSAMVILPSALIRNFDTPDVAAAALEDVLRHQDAIVGFGPLRKYPHRVDTDIAMPPGVGGYNAGIVSTVPISWMKTFLDPADNDWWGLYHEIGHGHQAPAWNRIGNTSELSNNIVLLYARHMINPAEPRRAMAVAPPPFQLSAFRETLAHFLRDTAARRGAWTGASAAALSNAYDQSLPFAKLAMFAFLSDHLSWQAFIDAFKAYREPGFAAPKDVLEQHTTFLVELSRASKRDLSAYFDLWGAPVTDDAKRRLAAIKSGPNNNTPLPLWVPAPSATIAFDLPIPPQSVKHSVRPWIAFRVNNFAFTGSHGAKGRVAWRTTGGPVPVSLDVVPVCAECQGTHQLLVGIKRTQPAAIVWSGDLGTPRHSQGPSTTVSQWSGTIDVPAHPGGYEVCVMHARNDNANAALAEAKTAGFANCETVGLVLVGP